MARYPAGKADLTDGQLRVVETPYEQVLVCRVDGLYYCVENRCSHDDGSLSGGWIEGCEIECPRHGARFDVRTGKVLCMPAVVDIESYTVSVEGDELFVEVD